MSIPLGQIAAQIGAELQGDPDLPIHNLAALESAGVGDISYVTSPKFRKAGESSKASALIVYPGYKGSSHPLLIVKDPYLGFARAMRLFHSCHPQVMPGIDSTAVVADDVNIPEDSYIGPNVVISKGSCIGRHAAIHAGAFIGENVTLGDHCRIFQNVTIRERVRIGRHVVIYSNAVIGSDGFGYAWDGQGFLKIPQVGAVVIEDNVEIGAGTTIDRATMGETVIGRGSIIDNLVQIAHNCKIGENSVICAQAGLAGTTTLGRHVTLAGQVGIAGHLTVGDGAIVEAQSGVAADIPPKAVHFGTPSRDIKIAHKIEAILTHLPDYIARLRRLEGLFKSEKETPSQGTKL